MHGESTGEWAAGARARLVTMDDDGGVDWTAGKRGRCYVPAKSLSEKVDGRRQPSRPPDRRPGRGRGHRHRPRDRAAARTTIRPSDPPPGLRQAPSPEEGDHAMATATQQLQNLINGELVDAAEGATDPVLNPATGEEIAHAPASGDQDVQRAVAAARTAFESFQNTTPAQRQDLLLKLADIVEENGGELAPIESANAGKPIHAVKDDEIPAMVDHFRFFAGAARNMEGKPAGEYLEGYTSWVRREPVGVVGQVTPWNYPLMMAVWKIGPALATGNAIVLKPAPTTPMSTLLLAELAAEFLPAGTLNVVTGDRDTGRALVSHPTPALVAITGSIRAGIQVAEAAAGQVKRVHLELGGKAPGIV